MTVRQLKGLLETAPDDAVVVVPSRDHSYRRAGAYIGNADEYEDRSLGEHVDDCLPIDSPHQVIKVLIVV